MIFSRSSGCRLATDLRWRGLRLLIMENELLRAAILLDKGADIVELRYKPHDLDVLWHSPTPLVWGMGEQGTVVHPEGYFADYYQGGWQEVLPNAGRFCEYRGARFGLHGEVWALPWECRIVSDAPELSQVELAVRCRRMPLLLKRRMSIRSGQAALFLEEELVNDSPVELYVMWGHHPAFGEPFLSPACRIHMPACEVVTDLNVGEASRIAPGERFPWPVGTGRTGDPVDISRIVGPEDKVDEMYYLTALAEPWWAMVNEKLGLTVAMAWSGQAFKCVWYWASLGGNLDWPSWGRFYAVALEPMSSWPAILTNALANGTALSLPAGGMVEERLTFTIEERAAPVRRVSTDGMVAS